MWYLCCSQEDLISNTSDGTSGDAQAYTREDVGVVTLTGVERSPIGQGDGIKGTTTGKDAPPLRKEERSV